MSKITNMKIAYNHLLKNKPDVKILSVVDYDNYFVFNTVPKNYNKSKDGIWLGGLTAVSKNDGKIFNFVPALYNPKKYSEAASKNIKYF